MDDTAEVSTVRGLMNTMVVFWRAMHAWRRVCVCVFLFVRACVRSCVFTRTWFTLSQLQTCTCMCVYVRVRACVCACMCVHIHRLMNTGLRIRDACPLQSWRIFPFLDDLHIVCRNCCGVGHDCHFSFLLVRASSTVCAIVFLRARRYVLSIDADP